MSVIIPAYNVVDDIDECVRSVVAQSHSFLEVILVDDGSTDGTSEVCDEWADRDARVRVLHGPNGGLSVARNHGIDVVKGEFVTFVDGDDVLEEGHVSHLLDVALRTGAALTTGGLVAFRVPNLPTYRAPTETRVLETGAALEPIIRSGVGFASCGKLIDREVLREVRFRPGSDFEDLEILPRLFAGTERVAITDAAYYGYRQRAGSLMDGHRKVLRLSLLAVLSSNIAFTRRGDVRWPGSTCDRLVEGYVLYAVRVLERAGRGVAREPGYERAHRSFVVPHLRALLKSDRIAPLYKLAILGSVISPGAFVVAMEVAHAVKRRLLPGLRRRR